MLQLKPGEKELYHSTFTEEERDLAITANKFILKNQEYTLIAMQDIRAELDAHEMTAWQKLVRVLTHEIMNSVTPVVSLTTAIKLMMEEVPGQAKAMDELDEETVTDIYRSVKAIENRGKGLLNFVNAYRDYTKPPQLELEEVKLGDLAKETLQVLGTTLSDIEVALDTATDQGTHIMADATLIGQVLINLVKNAREALEGRENATIKIRVQSGIGRATIAVSDNGPGIPPDLRQEIFVPFFTTKEKGTGIGLSLSKQIMKAHGGDLRMQTSDKGTTFTLSF